MANLSAVWFASTLAKDSFVMEIPLMRGPTVLAVKMHLCCHSVFFSFSLFLVDIDTDSTKNNSVPDRNGGGEGGNVTLVNSGLSIFYLLNSVIYPFQNVGRFDVFRFVDFIMHLDIHYI